LTKVSAETNADLVRLQHASALELGDVLERLLKRGEALDAVAQAVEGRMDSGVYVLSEKLAELIGATKSASLYARARQQLLPDLWSLLRLYRAGYPDPEIEKRLTKELYETAGNDAEPRRRYIVEAMRDAGTPNVLPTLEAILFDQAPTLKSKQVIAQAMESVASLDAEQLLRKMELGSRRQFLASVAEAVAAISARGTTAAKARPSHREEAANQEIELENAELARARAEKSLQNGEAVVAVMCLRPGAEALAKHIYRLAGYEKGGRPAATMMLEDLIAKLKDTDAPRVFKLCLQTMQLYGNFASHDQDDQLRYLTPELASQVLAIYSDALEAYREWLKGRSSQ
jgi:hypothetical protein